MRRKRNRRRRRRRKRKLRRRKRKESYTRTPEIVTNRGRTGKTGDILGF